MALDVSTPPRRRGHDPESVLSVAVGVFNERGYDGTSMEDLARALGVTKSAIYHHVPGKEQLLARALDRALDGLSELAADARAARGPAIDRLERVVRQSVRVLTERLPYVTLLLRVRGNSATERAALARRAEFGALVGRLVDEAAEEGALRPGLDPALVTRLLFGAVGSIAEWHRPEHGAPATEVADALVGMVFDGLKRG
ncbi:Biofilm operon icaADBC HTH-type negative transcriptional regulator IcaR [Nonomuraea coxensis DSM 45129]|uniref:Biofilm operon icaADBC HTH-type negative transcriptional regulator IcaR n=1 Tax=Nonomuraea coxensis DSM 45129 TaxID=1122611 RepID=A0ABX8UAF6_9ACTN|nr:TetR/AcrR family transcriptional regulator [Nonomuraea coxensis]QYC43647.1 Biofilm operon icaADBC HTH-type negative transcriptional regulator IcaR [Nonomuraea coxensis DSM 45129]